MKKKAIISLLIHVVLCSGCLAQIKPQGMPVLEVTIPGIFTEDMDYVCGTMKLQDVDSSAVILPAKFRTRGATAREYMMKPSFNMKLRDAENVEIDSMLLGLRSCSSWILDAMAIDRICMRNRVAFDIWNEFSRLPYKTDFDSRNGTVGKFVEVYINTEYKGIYCLSDRINRKLLDLKKTKEGVEGPDTIRGVLYKHGTQNISNQNEPCFSEDSATCVVEWHNAWELTYPDDHGGKEVWQPLIDAIANFEDYDYVSEHCYLDNLADCALLVMALAIQDNWGNKNKYASIRNIQTDGNKARMVFTPWDLDTSLGGSYNGSRYDGTYTKWPLQSMVGNAPAPLSICLTRQEFMELMKSRWLETRDKAFSVESVKEKMYAYRDLFISSGAWERQLSVVSELATQVVTDLAREIDLILEWYQNRHDEMDEFFGVDPSLVRSPQMPEKTSIDSNCYTLTGQRTTSVSRGIYIQNNRKYYK